MGRFILRYRGPGQKPAKDVARVRELSEVRVLDDSAPRMLLVEAPAEDASAPARFWGLVVVVSDLDALARRLGPHLSPVKPAVQPGRRIATVRGSAGVSPALAFMTPEP